MNRQLPVIAALATVMLTIGCGGGGGEQPAASETPAVAPQPTAKAMPAVQTVTAPGNPCDWVPVADVEAVLGPLSGPPTAANGCRYTLQLPDGIASKRQKAVAVQQKLAEMGATLGSGSGALGDWEQDPNSFAIVVSVDPSGSVAAELGAAAAGRQVAKWSRDEGGAAAGPAAPGDTADGWDRSLPVPYGFGGREGHLVVIAEGQAPDVPRDLSRALAALFRDRIPDLPFPSPGSQQSGGPDPCGLLTREAAEAVLGGLLVPPYRSSAGSPLADPGGASCSYFTQGHHVLVVTPTWTGGQQEYKTGRVFGAMTGTATGERAQKIEGPWDHGQVSTLTGGLGVLKGDTLLQIDFLTSSTDEAGAVQLAKQAVTRL